MTSPKPSVEDSNVSLPEADALRFAESAVSDVGRRLSYRRADLLAAVQHHARWGHVISGLPLEREFLFRRDVIAVAVQQLPMRSEASLGRRRAVLLRVAEELGVAERSLPPLHGSEPSAPYTGLEVAELRLWAAVQRESRRPDAWALLALGVGAGLAASEVCAVTARDVGEDGTRVHVVGPRERVVRVDEEWCVTLAELVAGADCGPLFVPGVRWYKNKIGDFVRMTQGDQIRPMPQRMRATWLVRRMSEGMPLQDLTYAAGIKSLGALARFERYLPAPSVAPASGSHGRR
jgi:integrase